MFLGYLNLNKLMKTPTNVKAKNLKLYNGKFNELLVSNDIKSEYSYEIERGWNINTVLHAFFNGNLEAGNFNYRANEVSNILIKKRKVGTFDWIIIKNIKIKTKEDFNFEIFDHLCKANKEYEYSLVPILNGTEGDVFVADIIKSEFDGLFLINADNTGYSTPYETKIILKQNKPSTIINTLGRKHPFILQNSKNNYSSGTAEGLFAPTNISGEDIFDDAWDFRNDLGKFLKDGKPKLLKYYDGRMWLIGITEDEITHTEDNHEYKIITSFNWAEIGDCEDGEDLYNNGFIDYNPNDSLDNILNTGETSAITGTTFTSRVVYSDLTGVSNINVYIALDNNESNIEYTTTTDEQGYYTFNNLILQDGIYKIFTNEINNNIGYMFCVVTNGEISVSDNNYITIT